ncbi:MAG TPA: cysteine hydrolase family protein [Chthonomonadaceae bacterium]|nr:cysteine hydrolase family protein [Chthonomonadaceae bacterium]
MAETTAHPSTLNIPCRYYRVYTDPGTPCVESSFHFVERTLPIPLEQAALVLVDVWSTHYIDSWLARARQVTAQKIVPLMEAARNAGLTIIHGPSPFIADRYLKAPPAPKITLEPPPPDWPPPAFRGIYRSGEYAAFGRDQEPILKGVYERYETELDISPLAKPLPGEPIIHTGDQMHRLLAERKILHLFYAGFATNWCMIGRDYAIYAMNDRGYNIILIRDATTGIEFHDTVATEAATQMQIREIETKNGWSTTTEAFVQACAQAHIGD